MKEKNLKIQTHSVITDLQKLKIIKLRKGRFFNFLKSFVWVLKRVSSEQRFSPKKNLNFRSQTFSRNFAFFSENKLRKKCDE